jgi:hypothetical protein
MNRPTMKGALRVPGLVVGFLLIFIAVDQSRA